MTYHIHIEGMGVLGSLIAHQLTTEFAGIHLTWHDIDVGCNAWRACTGAVYPSGDRSDEWARSRWWLSATHKLGPKFVERANYWFSQKHPPHKGKYQIVTKLGSLKCADPQSIHFNAQTFVPWMQERLGQFRKEGASSSANAYIVAHGFGPRLSHYYWGWSRRGRLAFHSSMQDTQRP